MDLRGPLRLYRARQLQTRQVRTRLRTRLRAPHRRRHPPPVAAPDNTFGIVGLGAGLLGLAAGTAALVPDQEALRVRRG
jgi:hypothetical protein